MAIVALGGRTLSDSVVSTLRDAIIGGELTAGIRLIDVDLAERLNVSRTTVRNAFQQLAYEGLILNQPYKGYFVSGQTPESILELLELRGFLEGRIAERSVTRLTGSDFARLTEMADTIGRRDYTHDVREIRQLDIAFHNVIAQRCDRSLHIELWSALTSRLVMLDVLCRDILKLNTADSAHRHHDYIAQLQNGDPTSARVAGEEHYRFHADRYRRILTQQAKIAPWTESAGRHAVEAAAGR